MQVLLLEDNARRAGANHSSARLVLPLVGQRVPWPRAGLYPPGGQVAPSRLLQALRTLAPLIHEQGTNLCLRAPLRVK